jgi:hypothetical protein
MPYLASFVLVLGALFASGANAQDAEEPASRVERWHPEAFVDPDPPEPSSEASEDPAPNFELNSAGIDVAPGTPRTADGYTIEQMQARVRKSRNGLIAGGVILGLGGA